MYVSAKKKTTVEMTVPREDGLLREILSHRLPYEIIIRETSLNNHTGNSSFICL